MSKINPKYVDGEPVCSENCPAWKREAAPVYGEGCTISWAGRAGSLCIPALRRDRDKLEAELAECKRENERLKGLIKMLDLDCTDCANCDNHEACSECRGFSNYIEEKTDE